MKELDKKKISAIVYCNNLILKELKDNGINCWVAGGILRDYFSNKNMASDCDIFFPSVNDYNKAKNYLKTKGAKTIFDNENGTKVIYLNNTFDLVKIIFKNPSDTINKSDFTVTMFATDGQKLYYGKNSFKDLQNKQLVINVISNPDSTFNRVLKHYKKGFEMSSDETKKLYLALNNLSSNQKDDLLNAIESYANYLPPSSGQNLAPSSGQNLTPTPTPTPDENIEIKPTPTPTPDLKLEPKIAPKTYNFVEKNKNYLLISLLLVASYITYKQFKK